jgi:hypothetical protein
VERYCAVLRMDLRLREALMASTCSSSPPGGDVHAPQGGAA